MALWIIAIFLLIILAYSFQKVQEDRVCFGETCFDVEIADTPLKRQIGLKLREDLDKDQGMLFIFDDPGVYQFWMQDTLIPLDIIWLNEEWEVVYMSENTPICEEIICARINPKISAKYVFEINAGVASEIELEVGSQLRYEEPSISRHVDNFFS